MKKQSLVSSRKLEDSIQKGSLYFLTTKGFDATKQLLNIDVEYHGSGYILTNERTGYPTQSDLPYEIYQPPRQQVSHHLLLIDLLAKLRYMSDEGEEYDHRLSMYCSTKYIHNYEESKIRPDAEIIIPTKETFWIEVDRATESHAQLLSKFQNYRNYFDYLRKNKLPIPISGIIFVTDTKQQEYGLKRRWLNILTAFLEKMHPYESEVRLLMTPLNKLEETLHFETNRIHLNNAAHYDLAVTLHNSGYTDVLPYSKIADKSLFYAIGHNQTSYSLFFSRLTNEYDSSLYTTFQQFRKILPSILKKERVKELQFKGVEYLAFYSKQKPYIPATLPKNQLTDIILTELEKLTQHIQLIKVNENK